MRLQIPLYMLVLRDLVGIEPMGGLYRALAGERDTRGLLRETAREDGVPGMQRNDYRDEDEFWAPGRPRRRDGARGRAADARGRRDARSALGRRVPELVRALPMCRVKRA